MIHEKIISSDNARQTEELAEAIGEAAKGGEIIELVSDLGGGKTTFVRGLAKGMGSKEKVSSPTYTISKVYRAGKFELHHFDFYRLDESGMMAHELAEIIHDPQCVTAIEWGKIVQDILPEDRLLKVFIQRTGEHTRSLTFEFPEALSYLVETI